jgi:mRNA interferase RelE/StbE
MYKIIIGEEAEKELYQIPHSEKVLIRIKDYLTKNPKELGKPLTGEYRGQYRYRYGDYRIIYEIDEKNNLILIVKVRHRKEAY